MFQLLLWSCDCQITVIRLPNGIVLYVGCQIPHPTPSSTPLPLSPIFCQFTPFFYSFRTSKVFTPFFIFFSDFKSVLYGTNSIWYSIWYHNLYRYFLIFIFQTCITNTYLCIVLSLLTITLYHIICFNVPCLKFAIIYIFVICFWEKNYTNTCAFVLIPICTITCLILQWYYYYN